MLYDNPSTSDGARRTAADVAHARRRRSRPLTFVQELAFFGIAVTLALSLEAAILLRVADIIE